VLDAPSPSRIDQQATGFPISNAIADEQWCSAIRDLDTRVLVSVHVILRDDASAARGDPQPRPVPVMDSIAFDDRSRAVGDSDARLRVLEYVILLDARLSSAPSDEHATTVSLTYSVMGDSRASAVTHLDI
jgi:hypothetical protein